jgi:hypothetical protein
LIARGAVRRLDALLRCLWGIREFSDHPDCILRIAATTSKEDVVLPDGTHVRRGDPIGELHFWNERMPPIPTEGPDLRWAVTMRNRVVVSLEQLAAWMQVEPSMEGIRALRAKVAVAVPVGGMRGCHTPPLAAGQRTWTCVLRRLGAELVQKERRRRWSARFRDFWEDFLLWGLAWTFNPASLRTKKWRRERHCYWMSRRALLERYLVRPDGAKHRSGVSYGPTAAPSASQGRG